MRDDLENLRIYELGEAFPTLDLSSREKENFRQVYVTRVVQKQADGGVDIYLRCTRIISRRDIKKLEMLMQKRLFSSCGAAVTLREAFDLEEASFAKIWREYRDSFEDELMEKSMIAFSLFQAARVNVSDSGLEIAMEDSFIAKESARIIEKLANEVFTDRFGLSPVLSFAYSEVKREAEDAYGSDVSPYIFESRAFAKPAEDVSHAEEPVERGEGEVEEKTSKGKDSGEREETASKKAPANSGKAYSKAKYAKKRLPDDPEIFYGKSFEGNEVAIEEILDEIGEVVVRGKILKVETTDLQKTGKVIISFVLTDFTDSIRTKIFVEQDEKEEMLSHIAEGKFVRMKAVAKYDTYLDELGLSSVRGIKNIADYTEKRTDNAPVKRIELHAHTQMSDMDAVIKPEVLVRTAFDWGHEAIAITDHGVVQAFTEAKKAFDPKKMTDEEKERLKNFKVIYGCEGYIVDDEAEVVVDRRGHEYRPGPDGKYSDEDIRKMPAYHIILLCRNITGRTNLYRLVSESHLKYYSRVPKIPKSLLREYREGIIVGSACEAGELFQAILWDKPEKELERIASFYDYYEIQPIGNNSFMIDDDRYPQVENENDLRRLNRRIYELGEHDGKLTVATCDVHFLNPEDEVYRRIIMYAKGFEGADRQPPLYLHTTEEMLREFSYLGDESARDVVINNPKKISDMIEKINPVRPDKCPPVIEDSDKTLREICETRARAMYGDPLPKPVSERLEHELESIIKNGFAVMYIIAQKLVWKSNEDGYLVGSRGSVGSSFVATMSGITEVNPLPAHYYCKKCHYSDFDSEEVKRYSQSSGCDMPDRLCPVCGEPLEKEGHNIPFETFLGFYGDKEPDIDLNFSGEYQNKAHDYTEVIFGDGQTFRAGTVGTLADKTAFGYVLKYCEEHDLTRRDIEKERLSMGCIGVKRTTGQHPGGIIVLPLGEQIYSFTPVQHPANDMSSKTVTTHFEYHAIDQNLLKLDILGHDDPTMIRALEDYTGVDAKTIRMDDEKVLSLFRSTEALGISPDDIDGCELGTLGLPELGTDFVIQMLKDTKPQSFSDMIRISGLSHGTDVWLNNTQTLIADGKCTLSSAICTRDDIMTYLISKGIESGKAFKIMESVRKGKGLTSEMEEDMTAHDVPDWYIWSCKRIKYMFPKAHACAYVMMAFRIGFYKINYPLAYYAAYFGIRAKAFDYAKMCRGPKVLKDNMNELKKLAKPTPNDKEQLSDMKLVKEMYARGFDFAPIDIYKSKARMFTIVDGKIMPSLLSIAGLGEKAAEQIADEASKGKFISKEDFKTRCGVGQTVVDTMSALGLLDGLTESNQISLFDLV
ncbi:MAG: PolC-type DNA polymerase III [Lachnospiraceae bacterium]|nr:PolC-type DNA polymerase III [Lachnospiraceae bacterium]